MSDHNPGAEKKKNRELPTDRLATTDGKGHRVYLYPAKVHGWFQQRRHFLQSLLIIFFLVLPWVKINGHQALLLDIAQRKFAILGITFWAHDAPMLFFIVGGAALTLGFVTAIWGRVWCGWACPQTVFIESVFRRIESLIEGDHVARKKLDDEPYSVDKFFKKASKWFFFILAALVISHSFIAYFVGTERLAVMIRTAPNENPISFAVMVFISCAILFDFGWFREQFCTILCPYGRFQSLLMDENSLIIAYDSVRGEPRKGSLSVDANNTKEGDCVNCYRCVQVCPTGVDIRRGTQLECIGCTACIDACDDVMERLHKPKGLIRYDSAVGLLGQKRKQLRFRTIGYLTILTFFASGLFMSIRSRKDLEGIFVRAIDVPYQILKNEKGEDEILNRFKADLSNQSFADIKFSITQDVESVKLVYAVDPIELKAGKKSSIDFFVRFSPKILSQGKTKIPILLQSTDGKKELLREELVLVGP